MSEKNIREVLKSHDQACEGKNGAAAHILPNAARPKRFYATVCVSAVKEASEVGSSVRLFQILLDGRALRTPARQILQVPSQALAELIADEFRAQKEHINPLAMPITRLANTVIDGIQADMQPLREDILRLAAADMVCYRADSPQELRELQQKNWDKVLDWAWEAMGAELQTGSGVMFIEQKAEALSAVNAYLGERLAVQSAANSAEEEQAYAPFVLAALHLMAAIAGSALLAFMVEAGAATAHEAWDLAHIEEEWTVKHWGRDNAAEKNKAARARDFYAAGAVLAALRANVSPE